MEWILIPIVLAICSAIIASNKNRSSVGWFFLTFLFCPVILILICLSKIENAPVVIQVSPAPTPPEPQRSTRECPYCAEEILAKARLCKHCGRDVEPVE